MSFFEKDLKKIWKCDLFCESDRKTVLHIFEQYGCHVDTFSNGDILCAPSRAEHTAGLILAGKATVTTPDSARNTLLRFLEPGALFGIANLFSAEPYISIVRANGPCRIFRMPEEAIRELLEQDRAFLYHYISFLSGRIRFLNRKIGYLTAGSAERRLALYLASLEKESFRLDASISSLSELLDVGRASLYRAFDKLSEDGFLRKDGRFFVLLDKEGMLAAYR